jgi:cyanate permease
MVAALGRYSTAVCMGRVLSSGLAAVLATVTASWRSSSTVCFSGRAYAKWP